MRYPWHLAVIGVVSLLWNGMGALDYVMTQTRNPSWMAQFSPEQLQYFYGFPAWAVGFWALGVWGAVAGSVLLLIRSALALWAFVLSLVGIAGTWLYQFALSPVGFFQIAGWFEAAFSAVIVLATVLLLGYARKMKMRGVLAVSPARPRQPMPADIAARLEAAGLAAAYAARPPFQRNDYLGWIAKAKRPATREARIRQMEDELRDGGLYMKMIWTAGRD